MIPNWAMYLPWREIAKAAEAHNLSPLLVAAMVHTESAGETNATRYERGYKWFVDPGSHARRLGLSHDTEVIAQATSFGLMQVMGGTARGMGFDGYIVELLIPSVGLDWGCRYLAKQIGRYEDETKGIAAYNAGSARYTDDDKTEFLNQDYVDKVLRRVRVLKGQETKIFNT